MMIRHQGIRHFSQIKLRPTASRSKRLPRPGTTLLGVSGILCCFLAAQTIYLDSEDKSPFASLKRRKSTEVFDIRRPVDVEVKLRQHEQTCETDKNSGISRFDIVQVSSNDPNEDDHATAMLPHPNGTWSLFAVFDGHSGWETSAWLRENMLPALAGSLADLYEKYHATNDSVMSRVWALIGSGREGGLDPFSPPDQAVEDTIKNTFKKLDNDIVNWAVERVFASPSKNAAINLLAPAYSGSCALLGYYDSHTRLLRIAVTGDSRAILGRRTVENGEIKYSVHVLSIDQDGHNPLEIQRLNDSPEHPGEEVIKNGRMLGMGPSRAFGDARWKWSQATQDRLKAEYLGRTTPSNVKTPPYMTAEPVITSIIIEKGDFLIMGTDGLWECLQNEEAVGLVGAWLNRKVGESSNDAIERSLLPVKLSDEDDTVRYRQWRSSKTFVNVDKNAATHLTRNALGGADGDLAQALLSMRSPRARTYRDDITAVVVFFNDE